MAAGWQQMDCDSRQVPHTRGELWTGGRVSAWEGGRVRGEGHLVCSHPSRSFCMLCNGEPRGNRTLTPGILGSQRGMPSAILFVVPVGPSVPVFPRWQQCPRDYDFRRALRVFVLKVEWWEKKRAGGGVPLGEGGS